ncbi:Acyl-coenzyme A dehydrogenase [Pseudoalteromonas holothuriae]|uniref:Acyl-coenzyme A dehydrogenase n=1 Tax=Pseudoalteromonas holothuriae TaxID=2963714 RepID=A0A9W4QZ09_9GAMM|nr:MULTISPECIES: acyl-CoA dehydrogenase [unclassified Pseudoalteromonas]CAH9058992.1 Acyl-coenzyme A dehydrogenase [Pseudoalteromonas sp. CIP111854]CAH9068278.1 Acyl-coenzyme A dehydrogenase [Pseudoalteromonas sp. CIP111951]
MSIIVLIIVLICIVFLIQSIRYRLITLPVMRYFKRALPKLTQTEQEAMEAGDTWWDSQLFSGRPDWQKWHQIDTPKLNNEEQAFIDNELDRLLSMLDEQQIRHNKDLPEAVWAYLKENGFFAFIIPKKFGGREFSAQANSTIVAKIASKSLSTAVTVMVPNSLGPAELLLHYGTPEQQQNWLPKLASGDALPCFALTALEAGSDAGAISDFGVICKKAYNGEEVLGIELTWSKRYITLAPVANVLGLAFKAYDPDCLLGNKQALGITCALIPTSHEGVKTGPRHNPLDQGFMNGTTQGKHVFIPLEWVIGGRAGIGKGWRMLVSCLSAGRGISLPALSAGTAHLCTRTTSAYSQIREQFGHPIAEFEGVQESLARIVGFTYSIEACRQTTAQAIDMNKSPAVITAIAKYHLTEMSRIVMNDALDIHGGKGIQKGPNNYLANNYTGIPISITVEGANILTRNLMIFGQGATRCHPYIFKEIKLIQQSEGTACVRDFDKLLMAHIQHTSINIIKVVWLGLSRGHGIPVGISGPTQVYYKKLNWLSVCLSVCADVAMLKLGGELKRKEMLSARLGDVLSHLYLASCVLKKYEHDGRQQGDMKAVNYAIAYHLKAGFDALNDFIENFTNRFVAQIMKRACYMFGHGAKGPSDYMVTDLSKSILNDKSARERVSHLCSVQSNSAVALVEQAYLKYKATLPIRIKFSQWQKNDKGYCYDKAFADLVMLAQSEQALSKEEAKSLINAHEACLKAISVDIF